ncbi:response regulator [Marinagarivorans algicola]|uniref:response regulator n=1 Tax=Marinagarivorans algicola TaxID=1513270 RepID=UPI0006B9D6B6|nr:response regulator [Marinagarivorans algicola]
MKKVLIVEDSTMVMRIIKHVVKQSAVFTPLYAETLAEAKALIDTNPDIFAAMVDLSLPDAPDGEIVDYTLSLKIPTLVLTASFDTERRNILLAKGIVDYVTKEGRLSYVYACNLIHRLIKNENVHVLVVDDSSMSRKIVVNMMRLHRYPVLEAKNGIEAIKVLLNNPKIKMLITDYNMPEMDGFELVQKLRVKYVKSELVIIGISSEGDGHLTARFIKAGANDFIKKPFNHEEFFCRITHNVEQVEMIEQIRDATRRDYHTGIYNRYYFFEKGYEDWLAAQGNNTPVALAVIDLDNFRLVNEKFGNDAGDVVMQHVATRLDQSLDRFLVARTDGQEFYVLMVGLTNDKACSLLEHVNSVISNASVDWNGSKIAVSFSAGVANYSAQNGSEQCDEGGFDELVINAYQCLHRAKDAGGDMIIGDGGVADDVQE